MILFCPNNKLPHKIFLSERNLIFFGYSSGNQSVQHGEQKELHGVVMWFGITRNSPCSWATRRSSQWDPLLYWLASK